MQQHLEAALPHRGQGTGLRVREIGDGVEIGYIEGAIRGAANGVRAYQAQVSRQEPAWTCARVRLRDTSHPVLANFRHRV